MTDDEFLTKFEQRLIGRAQWTHAAHVRMAWLYVARTGTYRAARGKVRSAPRRRHRRGGPCRRGSGADSSPSIEAG